MSVLVRIEDDVPHLAPHTLRDVVEAIEDRFPQAKVKAEFDEGYDGGVKDGISRSQSRPGDGDMGG